MADEWYYTVQGQQQGPVSTAELKQLAATQQLQPGDLVWREGLAKWVPASAAKGLFPEGQVLAPAAAPAAAGPTPVAPLDDRDDDRRPPRRRDDDDYARPRRRRDEEDFEDDYARPRRRRPPPSSSKGLIIGLIAGGVGLVVVVGVIVLLVVLLGGPGVTTLTLHNGQVVVNGELTSRDRFDQRRLQSRCRIYTINLTGGRVYQIDMVSGQVDSYLRLENAAGVQLAFDDDGGGFPNARIIFVCPQTGNYRIICTTFNGNATGSYTLSVHER